MLAFLLLLACGGKPAGDDSGSDSGPPDTLACTATVAEAVTTVVTLAWEAPAGATSWVEFGADGAYDHATPVTDAGAVSLHLLGMTAETDVSWRGISEVDGERIQCTGVTRTGELPADLPEVRVTAEAAGQDDARYALGAFFTAYDGRAQVVVYDRAGAIVWYHNGVDSATGLDVHFSRDGAGFWYNVYEEEMGGEETSLRKVSWVGEELVVHPTPGGHHMFVELPDGTLTWMALDKREYTHPDTGETDVWVGDALVEIAPDGTQTTVFSVWDWLTPSFNRGMDHFSIYGGLDWTHGNHLRYDDATDRYTLSLGHAADVIDIDRATMAPVRIFGPDGVTADPPFDYQHGAHWLPDGNLLMYMSEARASGAIEYTLVDGVPTEVWRHGFEEESIALGQAERLANGNTMVNYGAGGSLEEVTPAGEVVWGIEPDGPSGFLGQFTMVVDLYTGR